MRFTWFDCKRKPICASYLLLSPCWALVKRKLITVSLLVLMCQLAPQGSAVCLGVFAKLSGIDCRGFLHSPRHPVCRTGVIFCVFLANKDELEASAKGKLRVRRGALKNPACQHTLFKLFRPQTRPQWPANHSVKKNSGDQGALLAK